jgi:predicted porin
MDFFYLSAFADGFSPGLQNLYAGVDYTPIKGLTFNATYHYLATTVNLKNFNRSLGHEFELTANYKFNPWGKLSAGYTLMVGTDTMKELKRTSDSGRLQWLWLSLNVTPRFFSAKW